ncbi:hypothetical protein Cgig2_034172 [Carnegiea gigantea]|uniref:SAP domain-containing protein n=1 Tax=Carnegiea gigantea TaxID=171969 RepID=A0A9Q1Q7A0_9CARY|nr:hypothetical protein Cgig2_034172 [Carnegiea gigantea]
MESKTLFHPYKPTGTLATSSFPSHISLKPFLAAYLLRPSLFRCRFRLSLRIFAAAAAVAVTPLVPAAKRCVLQLRPIISLMKTPSKYPVLDNRSIDQWKVPELKEELKRRKLTIGGLKQDLIKRLDEAIRAEKEAAGTENNGVEELDTEIATDNAEETTEQAVIDTGEAGISIPDNAEKTVDDADGNSPEADVILFELDSKDSAQQQVADKGLEKEMAESVTDTTAGFSVLTATDLPSAEMENKVCDGLSSDVAMAGQGLHDDKMERGNEDLGTQLDSDDLKPPHEDVKLNSSDPTNQVSEVSTNLGFPVKSNSISTDSVSICEKNDLEDNIITDNVKLEHDVKPEMVQPSSSNLAPDGGKSHPMDVEEPHENKVSVEEIDNNVTIADMSQRNHSADLCSSEKLNLDRSSGDDSVEEDALESKQIDSNCNSEEVGERPLKIQATSMKGERPSANMDADLPTGDKSIRIENKDVVAASSEKRKLPDPEAVVNNEPSKRQRRWTFENTRAREPQISTPAASAKDVTPSAVLRRNLSGSNSVGFNDAPKEREVPPSTKAPTNSLRIDRFLRPFTLKAVQELLGKTGTVTSFWMDHIKTHCYVTVILLFSFRITVFLAIVNYTNPNFRISIGCMQYSSVEEAVATRNAVYNLQWPPNGGRNLIADFVDPQEVKTRVEAPAKPPAAPANTAPTVAPEPSTLPQPSPRQQNLRQQMPQPPLPPPPPPPLPNPGQARERSHLPPPPPVQEKVEASIVTLDDLFRKTKATPRIYYLPLSEEQVSAKVEARLKNPRQ